LREIVVISGKGGTGKTSLVASFAALAENAVLADCDVDAADLHIILEPNVKETHDFVGGKRARVVTDNGNSREVQRAIVGAHTVGPDRRLGLRRGQTLCLFTAA